MTTPFVLVVLDDDHMILTTKESLTRDQVAQAQEAFQRWRDEGGALVITQCLVIDRKPIHLELDLEGRRADNADIAMSSQDPPVSSPGVTQDVTPRPRGLLSSDSKKNEPGMLDRR